MTLNIRSLTSWLIFLTGTLFFALHVARAEDRPKPYWYEPMKALHENFHGNAGYVAQLGDSITMSLAFWTPLGWDEAAPYLPDDGLPKNPLPKRWRDVLKGFRDKGAGHGNQTGWTVGNLNGVTNKVLDNEKPEVAMIMIGTNDIATGHLAQGYREHLESIVNSCLHRNCIPILNTIPPRRGAEKAAEEANDIVRKIAQEHQVPLVDYYAEIMKRRPGRSWDGNLVGKDGVHPNNENGKANVYSEDNMKVNGYALRTYLDFLAVRKVYFLILHPIR